MEVYFPNNEYHTDSQNKRFLLDRISLGTRFGFFLIFLKHLFRSRKWALQGIYDTALWAKTSIGILKMIEGCGGKFHILGLDNIRNEKEPVVFISNHMSTLETMVFPGIIAPIKEATFVVKDSLVSHPLFGPIMRARKPIVVSRSDSMQDFKKVMSEGQALLEQGNSIIIFPQSKRVAQFDPNTFNTLGVKLARAAKVKIIPIAIKTDYWDNGSILKDVGAIHRDRPIYIEFGKAMEVQGAGKEEHQAIIDFISKRLKNWGGKVLDS